jgi:O-antigen ligase
MFISEIVSYGIFFELWTYKNISPSDPSPFMNHTDYSVYLTFTVVILLTKIFYEDNLKYKIIYLLFTLSVITNLLINGGRTGQVIFIFAIILFFILNMRKKLQAIVLSLSLIILSFSLAYNFSPNFHNRALQASTDISNMLNNNFKGSFATRVSLWVVGVQQASENLIFGAGIGNEMNTILDYSLNDNWETQNLSNFSDHHNMFISYLNQLGIIGLVLILYIFYSLFKLEIKNKLYRNLNYVFLLIFILLSFVGKSFHLMDPMVLFALFAGLFNKISYLDNGNIKTKYS